MEMCEYMNSHNLFRVDIAGCVIIVLRLSPLVSRTITTQAANAESRQVMFKFITAYMFMKPPNAQEAIIYSLLSL